ncbi:energy transducer TonB [Gracilimonas sp.]|uniref:energy transducer TonB n=1 Tax=Gracilimonas sp. TaxID=1974203 RepID=UPI003BAD1868
MNKSVLLIFLLTFIISCTNGNDNQVFEFIACTEQGAPIEFLKVTEKPTFANGEVIKENAAQYPEMARRNDIEGVVEVSFEITSNGEAHDVYISNGIGGGADETSLSVVQNSQFVPAKFKNNPQCVRTKASVLFELDNPDNVILSLEFND